MAPQKEIKPRTFQLNDSQTIFLGGVARFDYIKGPHAGIVAYFENSLPLHRTKLAMQMNFMKNTVAIY